MFRIFSIKKLAILVSVLFLVVGILIAIKPGWKEYKGDGFSIKYPAAWKVEVLEERPTFHGEETLLFGGDKAFLHGENIRMTVSRTSKNIVGPLTKSNSVVSSRKAYVTKAESDIQIYKKEIRYEIETDGYIYEIKVLIFRKGSLLQSYLDEFIVRNIAGSLKLEK